MAASFDPPAPLPPPPWEALRRRLLQRAAALQEAGNECEGALLKAMVGEWWQAQRIWNAGALERLKANHEINNALVGVSGNAQLLLMSPLAQQPAFRERLGVVLREAERIERAVRRLQDLKSALLEDPNGDGGRRGDDAANAA